MSFGEHAEYAVIGFISPTAYVYGPRGYASYFALGPRFQLTGVGCVGESEKHGECVAASTCASDSSSRMSDGLGSCGAVAYTGDGAPVCCVPRTSSPDTTSIPPYPGFIFPSSYEGAGTAFFHVGQTITIRLHLTAGSPFTLYEIGYASATLSVGPYWLRTLQNRNPTNVRELVSDDSPPSTFEYQYTVEPFDGVPELEASSTAVPTKNNLLALEYVENDEPVYVLLSFDVVYPPCKGEAYSGISFDWSNLEDTSIYHATDNLAGQCMSTQACESISSAQVVEQGKWAYGDTNDECGADLGEDVVCCRMNGGQANDVFRKAVGDESQGGLSTAAIAGIVAGGLCVVALCIAVICSVGLLAHRRRRKTVVLSPSPTYTTASGPHYYARRSHRVSRSNSRRF